MSSSSPSHSAKCTYHFGSITTNRIRLLDKGSVTQASSLTTGVDLPAPVGVIRTFSGTTMITGASISFSAAHPSINSDSIVFTSIVSYNGVGIPQIRVASFSAGSCTLTLSNPSHINSLTTPVTIAYRIM